MLHAAQIGEDLFLGLLAHRTGIKENDIRLFGVVGHFQALIFAEHVDHFVGVVLIHLAAEGADIDLATAGGVGGRRGIGRRACAFALECRFVHGGTP